MQMHHTNNKSRDLKMKGWHEAMLLLYKEGCKAEPVSPTDSLCVLSKMKQMQVNIICRASLCIGREW